MAYTTTPQLKQAWGTTNIGEWASRENNTGEDVAAIISDAISAADAEIEDALREGPYEVPLRFNTNSAARRVRYWANVLAAYELLLPRLASDGFKRIEKQRDRVMAEMREVQMGARRLDADEASDRGERQPTGV